MKTVMQSQYEHVFEIEAAIRTLSDQVLDELAEWIEALQRWRKGVPSVDAWLQGARGAAKPGVTTNSIMTLTRAEK